MGDLRKRLSMSLNPKREPKELRELREAGMAREPGRRSFDESDLGMHKARKAALASNSSEEVVQESNRGLLVCSGCSQPIKGNCLFDDSNDIWHFECYQLLQLFEDEEEDEDDHFEDIQMIVRYWRNLYYKKSEESDYYKSEKDSFQQKLNEWIVKYESSALTQRATGDISHHPIMITLRDKIESLENHRIELLKQVKSLTVANNDLTQKVEMYKSKLEKAENTDPQKEIDWKTKYEELLKASKIDQLKFEQQIVTLEAKNELLQSQIDANSNETAATNNEREVEVKMLQEKIDTLTETFEEEKKKKALERKNSIKESAPVEGLSLIELQHKYDDLKKNYDTQVASLKGSDSTKKVKKEASTDELKSKKVMEAEAAIIKEGPAQYKIVLNAEGKKQKAKDWNDAWIVLNNQFLEFYASQEERFTKKKVKIDLTGSEAEFDKETKKKKEVGGVIKLTTETQGSYQIAIASMEESEEWLKLLQQVCDSNLKASLDEIAAGLARRSHCIPHRFKETGFTLSPSKCKVCNTMIHVRGFRCIHCNFPCHEKCSTKVPPNCGLADMPTKPMPREKRASVQLKPSTSSSGLKIPEVDHIENDVFEVELSQLPGAEDDIPLVVSLCVSAIERKGGLELEGLYRVPGIKGDIDKLRLFFSYGRPNLDDEHWSDINVIGGALKLWLRLLPGSLLTAELFDDFVLAVEKNHKSPHQVKIQVMKDVLAKLPRRNYHILKYLVAHLQRVAEKGNINKMNADNLGAVFGPSLMRSPKGEDIGSIGRQCAVIEFMIRHYLELFES